MFAIYFSRVALSLTFPNIPAAFLMFAGFFSSSLMMLWSYGAIPVVAGGV